MSAKTGRDKLIKELNSLKKCERENNELVENLAYGIIRTRVRDGLILYVNPAYCRLLEYDAEDLLGKSTMELGLIINNEQRRRALEHLEKYGELHDFEFNIKTKSGKVRAMSGTARAIYDDDGSAIEIEGIVRDLTERKRVEETSV